MRDAHVLRGHAVRANYLASGAVDVAVDTGDTALLDALRSQWEHTIARRTYITGGQGSHHQDEAFGDDWELPPDRAYSETCAGIGSIMFAWRLLLADGDPRYADLIERTLYNVVATSPSDDGRSFYYANTLHQRVPGIPADPDETSPRASSSLRAPWFEVSCCPPNVARTFASLAAYVATADDTGVQVHQYASASVRTTLRRRTPGRLRRRDRATRPRAASASRSWATRPANGRSRCASPRGREGARVRVTTADGVEETGCRTRPLRDHPGVPRRRCRGARPAARASGDLARPAHRRGPRLRRDRARSRGARARVDRPRAARRRRRRTGRHRSDRAAARVRRQASAHGSGVRNAPSTEWPYGAADAATEGDGILIPLVPYHSWANRGPSTMRVWIPTS